MRATLEMSVDEDVTRCCFLTEFEVGVVGPSVGHGNVGDKLGESRGT